MSQKKYCCEKFELYNRNSNLARPNIRVVRYTSDFLLNSSLSTGKYKSPYRYYITFGYEEFKIDLKSAIFIEYCPFCGKDLYKYYKDDSYVNEIEGETFVLP